MTSLREFRARRPAPWPDQAIYLEAACAHHGVAFGLLDPAAGTLVRIGDARRGQVIPTVGRTCVYPLNSASAMALSTDKYFTRLALDAAGAANFGGSYYFLTARHKALRGPGHEIADARADMEARGFRAFCKPLAGSRGDFAEIVASEAEFDDWLSRVSQTHDAILIQDIFEGDEYRVFLVDEETSFVMQRFAPDLVGDGRSTAGMLHAELCARLAGTGVSPPPLTFPHDMAPAAGQRLALAGRRNASAGAATVLVAAQDVPAGLVDLAQRARMATGLRVAGVDVMHTRDGLRVIEINGNPAIASLEALGREDMILRLWSAVFRRMGLVENV